MGEAVKRPGAKKQRLALEPINEGVARASGVIERFKQLARRAGGDHRVLAIAMKSRQVGGGGEGAIAHVLLLILPALNARNGNADDMSDCFDFSQRPAAPPRV